MRYVIHPGWITGTDDEPVYVDAQTLVQLYGLSGHTYVVAPPPDTTAYEWFANRADDVHLYPREDGKYELPPECN